jgi:probable phosphoglycerate mutase
MTKFYFVRHAETEINKEKRFNGALVNSDITKQGRLDTIKLAENMRAINFDAVYSSPILRALETAEIIIDKQSSMPKIEIREELKEINLGKWDGTIISSNKNHPEFYNYFNRPDQFNAEMIQGESFYHLIDRGTKILKDIYDEYPTGNILIVSHGVILTVVMNYLLGVPLPEVRNRGTIDNSSLTILETREGELYKIIDWNKTY